MLQVSANDQYAGPRSAACRRHLIIFPKYLFGLSATEFCGEVSAPVSSRLKPSFTIINWNALDRPSSFPWSIRIVLSGFSPLNLLSIFFEIIIDGDFDVVRKIHMYRVTLSTIIKYELKPSILVTVGSFFVLSCTLYL